MKLTKVARAHIPKKQATFFPQSETTREKENKTKEEGRR